MKKILLLAFAVLLTVVGFATNTSAEGLVFAMATPVATDIDAIAKWAGKYDRKMVMQMLNGLDVFKDLKVDRNVSRQGKLLPKFTAEAGMRPLDTGVDRNNRKERTLAGRMLYVNDCMKLFNIVPEEARESFLSDMIAPGAKELPFAQWFWQREMEKLASEINDNFYLSEDHSDAAAWVAGDTYTAGDYMKFTDDNYYKCVTNTSAGESPITHAAKWLEVNGIVCFDGPAKIIADALTASEITATTTGALTAANALEKVELVYNDMTTAHRKKGGIIHLSPDSFRFYLKHEQSVFGNTNTPESGDGRKYVYGSGKKWEIKEASWMETSGRIIVNVQGENLIPGTTIVGERGPSLGKMVPTVHGYLTSAKWLLGFQVADLECLYVNDQA
tara:strand:+ start:1475 stop:2638 length:1164 start_codon:yes stop_codon:yes gene_type:complete